MKQISLPTRYDTPFVRYDLPVILRMMSPVLFIMIVSLNFGPFVIKAIEANLAINLGIILAASYGVVLIFIRLLGLQSDMRVLARFSHEASGGVDMKELIEQPWIKGRAVSHYLEPIAHTEGMISSQLDQDAIQNELHALSEEYNSKMELPQFIAGFMIAMGLLGTFIGLLETLTGISGMLDGMGKGGDIEKEFSKLVVELRKPLAGMGIAFSASMFGLVTSLMLSIMMTMLRRYTSRVLEKARSVMHRLLTRIKSTASISAGIGNVPAIGSSFVSSVSAPALPSFSPEGMPPLISSGAVHLDVSGIDGSSTGNTVVITDKISDAYFKSQDAIVTMANSVNMLVKRMDSISRSLEESIETSQKTNSLLNFGPRMTDSHEQLLQEVRVLSQRHEEGHRLFQKIISSLIQIDQALMSNNTQELVVAQRETTSVLNELFAHTQTHTRLLGDMTMSQKEAGAGTVQSINELRDHFAKLEDVNIGASRHLWEIKESFMKTLSSFKMIDSVVEETVKQTALSEASLTEERNTQKILSATVYAIQNLIASTARREAGAEVVPDGAST